MPLKSILHPIATPPFVFNNKVVFFDIVIYGNWEHNRGAEAKEGNKFLKVDCEALKLITILFKKGICRALL